LPITPAPGEHPPPIPVASATTATGKGSPTRMVADATMRLDDIVSKSRPDQITHIWINLKPCGRILAQTRRVGNFGAHFSNIFMSN
jgi:hypothetical protein